MTLHENEIAVDEVVVRSLLREQCPQWAELPLAPAGAGTDNTMYRLGDEFLVRHPRTAEKAASLRKEWRWLPRFAPLLTVPIPEPVYSGSPGSGFPLEWSIYRRIDGSVVGPESVADWATFGSDLAAFVRELHRVDLMGQTRAGDLRNYRGGRLQGGPRNWRVKYVAENFAHCRRLLGSRLDLDALEQMWLEALALPDPSGRQVWLHGDLKPANLLARNGKLHAVIDFGALSVGFPDAEHATLWDVPAPARQAYRNALDIDDLTWTRARAWAPSGAIVGIVYYWRSWPAFAAGREAQLRDILAESGIA